MKIRASRISASITRAISREYAAKKLLRGVFQSVIQFFALFRLVLTRYRSDDFLSLRQEVWQLDEAEYVASFQEADPGAGGSRRRHGKQREESQLVAVGDLGYSGSTFFTTPNGKYLIKSLPRRFEHEFFARDLFDDYVDHMRARPESLLVRITDMVRAPQATLGGMLGVAPTHHIVMENLLYGKEQEREASMREAWETYDLKPSDFFFPERDLAGGKLAPDSVIERLVDEFPDRVRVTAAQKRELRELLEADTALLAGHNAVDYSIFLVRFPGPSARGEGAGAVPSVPSVASGWRAGLDDVDGLWTYRLVVLDFFWAKHKLRAKAMTGLVGALNLVARKGPMSITADPAEYRERFLKMVDEMVIIG
ncbi:hypothetical protein B0I35DRAFT_411185 [Stachybotrys elegans]|uniref:PIPK domain-containing protein n=1 Tax=Stachybotrys elegans TaxID=80388 RepID=A0A8K0SQQ7_9HYPO|nr:hypothetical protein B0I35DRAFT_411185 [Stachybotrys elegans]